MGVRLPMGNEARSAWSDRLAAETAPVKELKALYNYTCQLCNHQWTLGSGEPLVTGYYLKPLSLGGPDAQENLLVLCPNHYVMFEVGALGLDLNRNRVIHVDPRDRQNGRAMVVKHKISPEFAEYHNDNVFKGF